MANVFITGASGMIGMYLTSALLQKKHPDFDCRNYGYKKLALLLEGLGFVMRKEPGGEDPNACEVYVKIKES